MGTLQVWMNGVEVALWDDVRNGSPRLSYVSQWISSPQSRPLSLSLPLLPDGESHRGNVVNDYFDNLLPDNVAIRNRIRDRFATRGSDTFDLLEAIGRDCVGAVQLLPPAHPPEDIQQITCEVLDEAGVATILRQVTTGNLPGAPSRDDAFRIPSPVRRKRPVFCCMLAMVHSYRQHTIHSHLQAAAWHCWQHAGRHASVRGE